MSDGAAPYPGVTTVRIRQSDLGRDGRVSTIGASRWFEDARIRLQMPRMEQVLRSGEAPPFRILLVGQGVERSPSVPGRAGDEVEIGTAVTRIGTSSFSYRGRAVLDGVEVARSTAAIVLGGRSGPIPVPEALAADLSALCVPDDAPADRFPAARRSREQYARFTPIRTRVGDLDSNRHVNFQVLSGWYDEAIADLAQAAVPGEVPQVAAQRFRIEYLGEVTHPGDYEIGLSVVSADGGDDGDVTYQAAIFRGESCLGLADLAGPRGGMTGAALEAARVPGRSE